MDLVLFYLFAAIAVGASIGVIGQRYPMYSVLLLIGSFIGLSGLYVLLDSPFTAVTQIIVYAGAIMVLFLFVVMLLNAPREEGPVIDPRRPAVFSTGPRRAGGLLGLAFLAEMIWALWRVQSSPIDADAEVAAHVSSVREIGIQLFTQHAFAFEVTSVLILVAMVGAVVLAKRNL
ncbi:MAG: NADH-quinone oxidoreductase subunit J [Vicinamibacteraceae bacterium]|nr:NADH-quinone oxidoreductase subunit J [Vicinamibacteraceae bacterium]